MQVSKDSFVAQRSSEESSGRQREGGGGPSPERVLQIRRCACVVKGGRRFSFAALVVTGDERGSVGYGYGKGGEVPIAVEKATKSANRRLRPVNIQGTTIPHQVEGRYGASRVVLVPASPGTGVIAGAVVRAVVESAGVKDILTKARGSTNPVNLVKATMDALSKLRTHDDIARLRGVEV
jgi:small subunit ribosomal protein S5